MDTKRTREEEDGVIDEGMSRPFIDSIFSSLSSHHFPSSSDGHVCPLSVCSYSTNNSVVWLYIVLTIVSIVIFSSKYTQQFKLKLKFIFACLPLKQCHELERSNAREICIKGKRCPTILIFCLFFKKIMTQTQLRHFQIMQCEINSHMNVKGANNLWILLNLVMPIPRFHRILYQFEDESTP